METIPCPVTVYVAYTAVVSLLLRISWTNTLLHWGSSEFFPKERLKPPLSFHCEKKRLIRKIPSHTVYLVAYSILPVELLTSKTFTTFPNITNYKLMMYYIN